MWGQGGIKLVQRNKFCNFTKSSDNWCNKPNVVYKIIIVVFNAWKKKIYNVIYVVCIWQTRKTNKISIVLSLSNFIVTQQQ